MRDDEKRKEIEEEIRELSKQLDKEYLLRIKKLMKAYIQSKSNTSA